MRAPVAVVTGGASGIGRATCAKLLAEGMRLAVLDLDGDAAKVAAGEGGLGVAADVSLEADVQRAFGAASARLQVCYAAAFFAEVLRSSAYASAVRLPDLAAIVRTAAGRTDDRDVADLADLIDRGSRLAR